MMNKLYDRILKRVRYTIKTYKNDSKFSVRYANYRIMDEVLGRIGFRKISAIYHLKMEEWIQSYLEKSLN